jgi:hypothetical protein
VCHHDVDVESYNRWVIDVTDFPVTESPVVPEFNYYSVSIDIRW